MKTINLLEYGFDNSGKTDCKLALDRLFNDNSGDVDVFFLKGKYYISGYVKADGFNSLRVHGDEATIITHFENNTADRVGGAFRFSNCGSLELKKLNFDTDVPASITATVAEIGSNNEYFILKVSDEFQIKGDERLVGFNSVDEYDTPDGKIVTYGACTYKLIDNNTIKILQSDISCKISDSAAGIRINIRHILYGETLIGFSNIKTALVEDVNIFSAPGIVFVIEPRCHNFSFNHVKVKKPEHTDRIFAANADGIHVNGLTGKLTIKDCVFENLGDDALNLHSIAYRLTDYDSKTLTARAVSPIDNNNQRIDKMRWCKKGDIINVYNPKKFRKTAEIRIEDTHEDVICFSIINGSPKEGDVLANQAYFASAEITGCRIANTRARGLLFQTENVLVENCHFYGMSSAAMIFSPDICVWYEVGPCKNITVKNCLFEKCNNSLAPSNRGAIIVMCSHGPEPRRYGRGVHSNFTITGNKFKDIGDSGLYISYTDGLVIENNNFDNCSRRVFDKKIRSLKYDIALLDCNNVSIGGNKTTKQDNRIIYKRDTEINFN